MTYRYTHRPGHFSALGREAASQSRKQLTETHTKEGIPVSPSPYRDDGSISASKARCFLIFINYDFNVEHIQYYFIL